MDTSNAFLGDRKEGDSRASSHQLTGGFVTRAGHASGRSSVPARVAAVVLFFFGLNGWPAALGGPSPSPPNRLPGRIEAEDFDRGGEGVGYHLIGGGCVNSYRPADPVCIEEVEGGWAIELAAGEWTAYTIQVPASGYYRIRFHCFLKALVYSLVIECRLELAGQTPVQTLALVKGGVGLPTSLGFSAGADAVFLPRGVHVMRVLNELSTDGGWRLDGIEVTGPTPKFAASILAGQDGPGFADGTGPESRFDRIVALDGDEAGNLYVADAGNHRVRRVTPAGEVTTLASAVTFSDLRDLGVDAQGNCYLRDGNVLRRISADGQVAELGLLRIPTGETGYVRDAGVLGTEWYEPAEYYEVSDLAVSRAGQVAAIGTAEFAGFVGSWGQFGRVGCGSNDRKTPLFVRSETGWTPLVSAQSERGFCSGSGTSYRHGLELKTVARGRDDEWLLGAGHESGAERAELRVATGGEMRTVCQTYYRAPAALSRFAGDLFLMHYGGKAFFVLKEGAEPTEIPVGIGPVSGLVVRPGGITFAASTNCVVQYTPEWFVDLTLEVKSGPPPVAELSVFTPIPLSLRIESSADLRGWTAVTHFMSAGTNGLVLGLSAIQRYYRAVSCEEVGP